MKNLMRSYNLENDGIVFVFIESAITSLFVGLATNRWWGLGTFIAIMVLYGFPVFAGVFSLIFSFVETIIIFYFLGKLNSAAATWIISFFSFAAITYIHRLRGNIDKVSFGYSLTIFEALVISGIIYIIYQRPFISIALFAALLIVSFIPIIRVIEAVALTAGTSFLIGALASESLTMPYAVLVGILVLIYMGFFYVYTYFGTDRKNHKQTEQIQEDSSSIYEKYPELELEKTHYYYITEVYHTDIERINFENSWINYLIYLNSSSEKITFNQYMEEKLHRAGNYTYNKGYKNVEQLIKPQKLDVLNNQNEKGSNLQNKSEQFYNENDIYSIYIKDGFWDSPIEEKIYNVLKNFIDSSYIILPHIALREIFKWKWESYYKLTNRVTKMHFDFGIYNKNLQPILFIEIYGSDHYNNPRVMENDNFKVALMQQKGLKLITIDFLESVSDEVVRDKLIEHIKKAVPNRCAYAAYCPRCGNLMKIRINRNNEYFYGCSTYNENNSVNCPGISVKDIPPLYYGIPTSENV